MKRRSKHPTPAKASDAKSQKAVKPESPTDAEAAAFIEGLIQRGEAVVLKPGEEMPPGSTHEVLGFSAEGRPIVKRRRLSAF